MYTNTDKNNKHMNSGIQLALIFPLSVHITCCLYSIKL